jgi:PAS domain S-box-containing protein
MVLPHFESSESVLSWLEQALVPTHADWCKVHFAYHGRLELVALAHRNPELTGWAFKPSQALPVDIAGMMGVASVMRSGKEELLNEIPPALLAAVAGNQEQLEIYQKLGFVSSLRVPLHHQNQVFAVVSLVYGESGKHYTPEDVRVIRDLLAEVSAVLIRLRQQEQELETENANRRWERIGQRYKNILEATPVSMMILGRDGITREVNQAWQDFWGYTLEHFVAQGVTLWNDPQLVETGTLTYFERAFAGEIVLGPPTFWDGRSVGGGQARWIRSRISPLKDENGEINEILIVHLELSSSEKEEAIKRLLALGLTLPDEPKANAVQLSPREREALRMIADGSSNKHLARKMNISENTAKFHVTSLFNKLGVNSRAQAVAVAVQEGLL